MPRYERILPIIGIVVMGLALTLLGGEISRITIGFTWPGPPSEYRVEEVFPSTVLPTYHAVNEAQNLSVYFTPTEVRFLRYADAVPLWEWSLALRSYGTISGTQPVAPAHLSAVGERIDYLRDGDGLKESYLNEARGLNQHLSLSSSPSQGGAEVPVLFQFVVPTSLTPTLSADRQFINLGDAEGRSVLQYGVVHAADAAYNDLAVGMRMSACTPTVHLTCTVELVVNAAGARYPVVVDSLITALSPSPENTPAGLDIRVSVDWLILLFLLLVVALGTESLQQEEWETVAGRRFHLHPTVWIVPVLLTLAAFLFLRILPGGTERSVGLGITGGLLFVALIADHYRHDARPRISGLSCQVLDILVYVVAFFLYGAIYALKMRSLFSATLLAVFTFLLAFALLNRIASRREALLCAAVVGLCIGEITWPLNYYPVRGMVGGAFLLVVFYALVNPARQHLEGRLTWRALIEYGVEILLGLGLIVVDIFWLHWGRGS